MRPRTCSGTPVFPPPGSIPIPIRLGCGPPSMRCPARAIWQGRRMRSPGPEPLMLLMELEPATPIGHVFTDHEGMLLDEETIRLAELIDPVFLTEAGWDRRTQTLTFPPEHPLLGRPICAAPGCQTTCH